MTPEDKLEKALTLLADREDAFETACLVAADTETEYRIRFAVEFRKASGGAELRKQEAFVAVEKELDARNKAEAIKEFTKEKLRDCQSAVSARQSLLNANLRTSKAFGA